MMLRLISHCFSKIKEDFYLALVGNGTKQEIVQNEQSGVANIFKRFWYLG